MSIHQTHPTGDPTPGTNPEPPSTLVPGQPFIAIEIAPCDRCRREYTTDQLTPVWAPQNAYDAVCADCLDELRLLEAAS